MVEIEIKDLVSKLSWEYPKEEQQKAINQLSVVDERYFGLLFNKNLKETWENVVVVIEKIGCPKNEFFIPELLWLLQDVNWPGSMHAIDVLLKQNKDIVIPKLEQTIKEAYQQEDYMWLGGLKLLVEKGNYNEMNFIDENTLSLLNVLNETEESEAVQSTINDILLG